MTKYDLTPTIPFPKYKRKYRKKFTVIEEKAVNVEDSEEYAILR